MEITSSETIEADGRQIVKAATLVMIFFVLSRLLGLVRQMVIGALFGTSGNLDAYMAAARIPEMIFMIVAGGALGSAFIPTFADYLTQDDQAGAWQMASAVLNLVVLALTVLAGLIALFAPFLVQTVVAPGFTPGQQALTTRLLRVMLLSSIIFGASGVVMSALNAYQHFLLPALAPSIYNLAIIGGGLLFAHRLGVMGLAVGAVVGSALHLLIQVPGLFAYGARYVPALGLQNEGVREVGRLMAPRVLGTAIVQINFVVSNSLASQMGIGAVSAINYAWMLMLIPQGVFAQAVGTAAFPTFASQVAEGRCAEMRDTLSSTLRAIFFLSLPATMGMIVLGQPLIAILFERGAFKAGSTEAVGWALSFYALGLIGHAGLEVAARAFYALHDTFTPVWVGAVAVAVNIALSLTLPGAFAALDWPPYAGLALAMSVATLLNLGLLLLLMQRRMGGLQDRRLLITLAKGGLATLVMGATLLGWQTILTEASTLTIGLSGVALGVTVYIGAALLFRAQVLRSMVRMVSS